MNMSIKIKTLRPHIKLHVFTFNNNVQTMPHSTPLSNHTDTVAVRGITRGFGAGAIFIKHFTEILKLRENFGTKLQQNQKTFQSLIVMVVCRSTSVIKAHIHCYQITGKKNTYGN